MTKNVSSPYRSLVDSLYYRINDKGAVQVYLGDGIWVNSDKDTAYLMSSCTRVISVGEASTVTPRRGWLRRLLGVVYGWKC